ncbi:hypothetical protein [Nonomuraea sp. NPDC050643]|uniref:hypothetical protein n=1 Tax=Nonomuraea sp. NPDC050643 TaxID=3155660 RepID=UPI0033F29D5B
MFDRMNPEKYAATKNAGRQNDHLRDLANAANGHGRNNMGVTRQQKERAQKDLVRAVGDKKAGQLKEEALRAAGAKGKGLRRWFG